MSFADENAYCVGMLKSFVCLVICVVMGRLALAQSEAPAPSTARLDPTIQKIVASISEDRIAAIMRKLESFETRNTLSDATQTNRGIGAARQWILDEFKSYSPRLQVDFDIHQIAKTNRIWKDVELRNVVA